MNRDIGDRGSLMFQQSQLQNQIAQKQMQMYRTMEAQKSLMSNCKYYE